MSSPGNTARDKVPVTTADQIPLLQAMGTGSHACCLRLIMYPGAAACLTPSTFPEKHENVTSLLRQQKLCLKEKPSIV